MVFFRVRSKERVSLFVELDWRYREFTADFSNGGQGSGTNIHIDVKLLQTFLAFGPEWVLDRISLRLGVQFAFVTDGNVSGTSQGWSMISGSDPVKDIDSPVAGYFNGGVRLLFGSRIRLGVFGRYAWALDPFFSPTIVSMQDGYNKIFCTDAGVRLLLFRLGSGD